MRRLRAFLWRTSFRFQFWCRRKAISSNTKLRTWKLYYFLDDSMKNIAATFQWGLFR